jgi:hypothetical protein
MPRYLIERHFGDMRLEDLDAPEQVARTMAANERFPEISWEHSHVIYADEGMVTYCVYVAPTAQMCRDHAEAAGVPADVVTELIYVAPGGIKVGPEEPLTTRSV